DPIPTADYYSLYGVFASCSEPAEQPMLGPEARSPKYAEYLTEHERRQNELEKFRSVKEAEIQSHLRQTVGDYLLAARDTQRLADSSKAENLARERKLDPHTVQRWVQWLQQGRFASNGPLFAPWCELADCDEQQFGRAAESTVVALG